MTVFTKSAKAADIGDLDFFRCEQITAKHGPIKVVHGIDLSLSRREVLAILGANGAGKSSLLGAIAGTVRGAGRIFFEGQSIETQPPHRRAKAGLAFVPEGRRNIFRLLTVAENLDSGLQLSPPETRARTRDFICELFPILHERADIPAGMLSGGEQQMLAIGVALGRRPRIILLDEPTQGLAPVVFDILQSAIKRLHESDVSILLAEQNLGFASRVSSRYVVLSHGNIVASGDAESMTDETRISKLYFGRN